MANGRSEQAAPDGRGPNDGHENLDERRFSGAVRAEQAEDLPPVDLHGHASECMHLLSKCLGGILDFDDGRHEWDQCITRRW